MEYGCNKKDKAYAELLFVILQRPDVDLNRLDCWHRIPLHYAAQRNEYMSEMLLSKGSRTDILDKSKQLPRDLAEYNPKIIELFDSMQNVDASDCDLESKIQYNSDYKSGFINGYNKGYREGVSYADRINKERINNDIISNASRSHS